MLLCCKVVRISKRHLMARRFPSVMPLWHGFLHASGSCPSLVLDGSWPSSGDGGRLVDLPLADDRLAITALGFPTQGYRWPPSGVTKWQLAQTLLFAHTTLVAMVWPSERDNALLVSLLGMGRSGCVAWCEGASSPMPSAGGHPSLLPRPSPIGLPAVVDLRAASTLERAMAGDGSPIFIKNGMGPSHSNPPMRAEVF